MRKLLLMAAISFLFPMNAWSAITYTLNAASYPGWDKVEEFCKQISGESLGLYRITIVNDGDENAVVTYAMLNNPISSTYCNTILRVSNPLLIGTSSISNGLMAIAALWYGKKVRDRLLQVAQETNAENVPVAFASYPYFGFGILSVIGTLATGFTAYKFIVIKKTLTAIMNELLPESLVIPAHAEASFYVIYKR